MGRISSKAATTGHSGNVATPWGVSWLNQNFSTSNEPAATVAGNPTNAGPTLPNTGRNSFRGPGVSMFNASLFRLHIYHESEFQIRFEALNLFNHMAQQSDDDGSIGCEHCCG